jgi:hypothetical protein
MVGWPIAFGPVGGSTTWQEMTHPMATKKQKEEGLGSHIPLQGQNSNVLTSFH